MPVRAMPLIKIQFISHNHTFRLHLGFLLIVFFD